MYMYIYVYSAPSTKETRLTQWPMLNTGSSSSECEAGGGPIFVSNSRGPARGGSNFRV